MSSAHRLAPAPRPLLALTLAVVLAAVPLRAQTAGQFTLNPAIPPIPERFTPEDVLGMNTYAIGDMTSDGQTLAVTMSTRRDGFGTDYSRDGDPTYVRATPMQLWLVDATTRARTDVFPDKRGVKSLRFSPDGKRLAMLLWTGESFEPAVYDRATKRVTVLHPPVDRYVAESSDLRWSGDGASVVFSLHTKEWKKQAQATFTRMTAGPIFIQSSKDPFLSWDELRRMGNRRSIGAIELASGQYKELVPESPMTNFVYADDGSAVTFTEDLVKATSYETGGNDTRTSTRRLPLGTVVAIPTNRTSLVWAEDGKRYAFAREGRVYVATIDDTTATLIISPPPAPAAPDSAGGVGARGGTGRGGGTGGRGGGRGATGAGGAATPNRENYSVSRFSPKQDALLVTNREGMWVVDLTTKAKDLAIATGDSATGAPRITFGAWSPDGNSLYFTTASRTKWERGVVRYDRSTKERRDLVKDGRTYSNLRLSNDGKRIFLTVAEGNRPGDIYSANAELGELRRFIVSNPQLEVKRFGATELMNYLDADGHRKNAVVYYPIDFQRGKPYPTVFIIYEEFFDDSWDVAANILAGSGYLVVKPSVDFETGFPGEAWVKGVTSIANKLIELGIADSSRLGVQGTSYGGYATNLLITQTKRFAAAINISGKVDLISFYTDSPRLGVRNITAAERSQDRIGSTLWQQPQKYIQHSAIMFADRIETPLMLITGARDSNVPADNSREMYYALRRLGKEVIWVNYMNGGHGGGNATADEFLDMHHRIVGWYDQKLKKQ